MKRIEWEKLYSILNEVFSEGQDGLVMKAERWKNKDKNKRKCRKNIGQILDIKTYLLNWNKVRKNFHKYNRMCKSHRTVTKFL